MIDYKLQYHFDESVSYDDGDTFENVKVGYDYYPAENNLPYDHNTAEIYDVFVYNAKGDDITYDLPKSESDHIMSEVKIHHARMLKEQNEI
jgi:hypothetical protein